MFYYRTFDSGERFRRAYQDVSDSEARIFRLASETTYEIVGSTLVRDDIQAHGLAVLSTENSTIVIEDSMPSFPSDAAFFDYGVCILPMIL